MSAVFKVFLSMSCSGSLLILVFLFGKRLLKNKISRQWQYYIWLVVILRLLLPFESKTNLLEDTYKSVDQVVTKTVPLPSQKTTINIPQEAPATAAGSKQDNETTGALLIHHIWLVWLVAAFGLFIRKITIYQGFIRYTKAGSTPVCDIGLFDQLSIAARQAGIHKPVELCVNPLISSPMLMGFFHPCIVLPGLPVSDKDFTHIVLHELTHYKRQDIIYKWLVQITLCLHWFNPLVHLMSREITKACEFSCDEAVLAKIGGDNAQGYGKTLLDAMAAVGKYRENPGAVTLSGNKQLLKERLCAIMNFKKKSKAVRLLTGMLTLCIIIGTALVGVYPATAVSGQSDGKPKISGNKNSSQTETANKNGDKYALMAEKAYQVSSLPLFQFAFSRLDKKAQNKWLDRIYEDENIAFMGAVVSLLDEDCDQIKHLAETAYEDGDIAFFSTMATHMSEDTLIEWLDRALEDEDWAFQSMLLNELDWVHEFNGRDWNNEFDKTDWKNESDETDWKDEFDKTDWKDEFDKTDWKDKFDETDWENKFDEIDWEDKFDELKEKQEKEWAEAQMAEYQTVGVTMDGKNYYYQGKLVNIFLDIRSNKSFYTLDMNPKGSINIKILRNKNNEITGVAYMTEAEITELFGETDAPDNTDTEIIPVDLKTVAAGEIIFLGEYTLSNGNRIYYDLSAETGNRMKIYFTKNKQKNPVYWSVDNSRQPGKALRCTADFTVELPANPETYQLYLKALDGALGNVKGSISISFAEETF